LACHDEFFVSNLFDIKENEEHALDLALHLIRLFQSWRVWTFPLGGLLLCLWATSDNPAQESCIVGGGLTKFLADVDMLLLLISCQKSHQVT
jgi:hypothetical protein